VKDIEAIFTGISEVKACDQFWQSLTPKQRFILGHAVPCLFTVRTRPYDEKFMLEIGDTALGRKARCRDSRAAELVKSRSWLLKK